jgi:hypothetical protein
MKKLITFHNALAEAGAVVLSHKPFAASTAVAVALPPHYGSFTCSRVTSRTPCAVIDALPDVTINARHIMLRTFVACS